MTDTRLDRIICYGTDAERLALVPDPPPGVLVLFYTEDAPALWLWDTDAGPAAWVDAFTAVATGAITYAMIASATIATADEYRAATVSKLLTPEFVWEAAEYVALASGANVSLDMADGFNFYLLHDTSGQLDNPTNMKEGQTGVIVIEQDTGGGFTLSYDTAWLFPGGTAPVLSANAGDVDMLFYQVLPGGATVYANLVKNVS